MEEKIYTVTLADGREIRDLTLNGNNFISKTPIDTELFKNNLCPTTIRCGEAEKIHENMEFLGETSVDGEHGFILRDISPQKLAEMKLRSDVEYIAMMCDVEL